MIYDTLLAEMDTTYNKDAWQISEADCSKQGRVDTNYWYGLMHTRDY